MLPLTPRSLSTPRYRTPRFGSFQRYRILPSELSVFWFGGAVSAGSGTLLRGGVHGALDAVETAAAVVLLLVEGRWWWWKGGISRRGAPGTVVPGVVEVVGRWGVLGVLLNMVVVVGRWGGGVAE